MSNGRIIKAATTESPECSSRIPVGLYEECGEHSSEAYCSVTNSACVNTSSYWLCTCAPGYVEVDGKCLEVPKSVFQDGDFHFNVSMNGKDAQVIGSIPFKNLEGLKINTINATASDPSFSVNANKHYLIIQKKRGFIICDTIKLQISTKVELYGQEINSMIDVYIGVNYEPILTAEVILIDGTVKDNIVTDIQCAGGSSFHFTGEKSFLFHQVQKGYIQCSKDVDITNITDAQTYAIWTKLEVSNEKNVHFMDIHIILARQRFVLQISEDKGSGVTVGRFRADSHTTNHNYTFSSDKSSLVLNTTTGAISIGTPRLDYESQRTENFQISMKRVKSKEIIHVIDLDVTVLDVNDNPPQFIGPPYDFQVVTGSPIGTLVGMVTVYDPDNEGVVKYSSSSQLFSITSDGAIQAMVSMTDRRLGVSNGDGVSFIVTADDGKYQRETNVTVSLIYLSQNITNLGRAFHVNVTENRTVDNNILTNVSTANYTNYRFIRRDVKKYFHLNATTGEVSAAIVFDREKLPKGFYDGMMETEVLGVLEGEDDCTFTIIGTLYINIMDVNDNPPCITNGDYEICTNTSRHQFIGSIPENRSPESHVTFDGDFIIHDADQESTRHVQLIGNNSHLFNFCDESGRLKIFTTSALDRETTPSYSLQLQVKDGKYVSSVNLLINLTDVNDNKPIFNQPTYAFNITENVPVGSTVGRVVATDLDTDKFAHISYRLYHSDFRISGDGNIITDGEIDRELVSSYEIIVSATDSQFDTYVNVTIKINDVNDNPPVFGRMEYVFTTKENTSCGNIGNVIATDKDEGNNALIEYTSNNTLFTVSPTGAISCTKVLDYEQYKSHVFAVTATDKGDKSLNTTAIIRVIVQDINDNPPVFEETSKTVTILKNDLQISNRIITWFAVSDLDSGRNGEVSFSLTGSVGTHFRIDASSGVVHSSETAHLQPVGNYSGIVTATDNGEPKKSATATININILAKDDSESIKFTETFYEFYLQENEIKSEPIGRMYTNMPNISVIFTIQQNDNDDNRLFTINSTSGELYCNGSLDRERKAHYTLFVTVSPLRGGSGDPGLAGVTIHITDVNDNKPVFINSISQIEISEDTKVGQQVTQMLATDADNGENGTVHFRIDNTHETPGSKVHFRINETTGHVLVAAELDRDSGTTMIPIIIVATDLGKPAQSTTKQLEVLLSDANDNPPYFVNASKDDPCYEISVKENTNIGKQIFVFTIGDNDATPPNRYTTITLDEHCPVKQVGDTLNRDMQKHLSLRQELDFESKKKYTCIIEASNIATEEQRSKCTLVLYVEDVNDNSPVIETSDVVNITTDTSGAIIATINATDKDSGENGQLSYILQDTEYSGHFSIDQSTGAIQLMTNPRFIPVHKIQLTVVVTDKGDPPLSSTTQVKINIIDSNTSPWFPGKTGKCDDNDVQNTLYAVSISETDGRNFKLNPDAVSNMVIPVTACDRIDGKNVECNCSYSFIEPSRYFYIDPVSGVITQIRPIDREENAHFSLKVSAIDNGSSPKITRENAIINITISDLDDNGPPNEVPEDKQNIRLASTRKAGDIVKDMSVEDPDEGINAQYHYSIRCSSPVFEINEESGQVKTTQPLMEYKNSSIGCVILATGRVSREHATGWTAIFNIYYDDPNKNTPKFKKDTYILRIQRDILRDTAVLTVNATDGDPSDKKEGNITYCIQDGNAWNMFSLGETSGVLRLNQEINDVVPPNREHFSLIIKASDQGDNPKSSECTVNITVSEWISHCEATSPCSDPTTQQNSDLRVPLIAVIVVSVILISAMAIAFLVMYNRTKSVNRRLSMMSVDLGKKHKKVYNDLEHFDDIMNPTASTSSGDYTALRRHPRDQLGITRPTSIRLSNTYNEIPPDYPMDTTDGI